MRSSVILILFITLWGNPLCSQITFDSERELTEFAFSNTDLENHTTGLFLDYLLDLNDSIIGFFNSKNTNGSVHDVNSMLLNISILQTCDVTTAERFEMDSLLYPIMEHYYSNTGFNNFEVPLFILNNNFSMLNAASETIKNNWTNPAAFPQFNQNDMEIQNIKSVALFIDTIVNNNVQFYWDDETFLSNIDSLEVVNVNVKIEGNIFSIQKGERFSLSSYYNSEAVLTGFPVSVEFSDGTIFDLRIKCFIKGNSNIQSTSQNKVITFYPPVARAILYPGCGEPNVIKLSTYQNVSLWFLVIFGLTRVL